MRASGLRRRAALLAAAVSLVLAASTLSTGTALGVSHWFTASRFCWPNPCTASVTAGSPVAFLVTARKFTENPWTDYTGKVKFTSTDPLAVLPAPYTFVASDHGDHGFTVTFKTAGTQTITVTAVFDATMHGTSPALTVKPAAADHLAFTVQPGGAQAGSSLSQQPRVTVYDPYGNRAVAATSVISLGLVSPPGVAASLACASGTVLAAVNGIAVFAGCAVDLPGSGFFIVATSPGLSAATSTAFDISAGPTSAPTPSPSPSPSASPSPSPTPMPPTAMVLTASRTTVTYPADVTLALAFAGAGAGRLVTVERRIAGAASWSQIGTITTDASSTGSIDYLPARTADYRAVWPGDATLAASTSASVSVTVRFQVIVSPAATTRTTSAGSTLRWVVTLRPKTAGVSVRLRVYQYSGGSWVLRGGTIVLTTNTAGKVTFSRTFATRGRFYMQATALAGPANATSSASKKYITVR